MKHLPNDLQLSGCTPEIADSLHHLFRFQVSEVEPGPIVIEALATLVDDHEKKGQEDMTVIGACE
jgi:hypothetical protein